MEAIVHLNSSNIEENKCVTAKVSARNSDFFERRGRIRGQQYKVYEREPIFLLEDTKNSTCEEINSSNLRIQPREGEPIFVDKCFATIQTILDDGFVLTNLQSKSGDYTALNMDFIFWNPKGFWKVADCESSASVSKQMGKSRVIRKIVSAPYVCNDSWKPEFLIASSSHIMKENERGHSSEKEIMPKWSALDDNIPFSIFGFDEEFILKPSKKEMPNTDFSSESCERVATPPQNECQKTIQRADKSVEINEKIVDESQIERDNTFLTSVPMQSSSPPRNALQQNAKFGTTATKSPNSGPMARILRNNLTTSTAEGMMISVPSVLVQSREMKPSLQSSSHGMMYSSKKKWNFVPQKVKYVVHNPLDRHPFTIAPPKLQSRKVENPDYTKPFQDFPAKPKVQHGIVLQKLK